MTPTVPNDLDKRVSPELPMDTSLTVREVLHLLSNQMKQVSFKAMSSAFLNIRLATWSLENGLTVSLVRSSHTVDVGEGISGYFYLVLDDPLLLLFRLAVEPDGRISHFEPCGSELLTSPSLTWFPLWFQLRAIAFSAFHEVLGARRITGVYKSPWLFLPRAAASGRWAHDRSREQFILEVTRRALAGQTTTSDGRRLHLKRREAWIDHFPILDNPLPRLQIDFSELMLGYFATTDSDRSLRYRCQFEWPVRSKLNEHMVLRFDLPTLTWSVLWMPPTSKPLHTVEPVHVLASGQEGPLMALEAAGLVHEATDAAWGAWLERTLTGCPNPVLAPGLAEVMEMPLLLGTNPLRSTDDVFVAWIHAAGLTEALEVKWSSWSSHLPKGT